MLPLRQKKNDRASGALGVLAAAQAVYAILCLMLLDQPIESGHRTLALIIAVFASAGLVLSSFVGIVSGTRRYSRFGPMTTGFRISYGMQFVYLIVGAGIHLWLWGLYVDES